MSVIECQMYLLNCAAIRNFHRTSSGKGDRKVNRDDGVGDGGGRG